MGKQFRLGDVLSITTGRLVSPSHIDGVYRILNYMIGDNLFTHQLPRVADLCKPVLLRQHPRLNEPECLFQVARLIEMLESTSGQSDPQSLVDGWLFQMTLEYGEILEVEPLRPADYEHKDPLSELQEMARGKRIIVIGSDSND